MGEINSAPSQVATSALQAIPFGSIIGAPLKACIEAQAMAAQTSWNFIQEVGLNTNEAGIKEAINVSFLFMQDGKTAQLNIPLLTIVPIPYIAIKDIDINFKANISASSSTFDEQSSSSTLGVDADAKLKIGKGPVSFELDMKANYSSKKDSKATQESKYSVEYTMDVIVKAGQDSMPAGMAKVLEILSNSMDVSDPKGTLEVSATKLQLIDGTAQLIATYKNRKGLFEPTAISGAEQAEVSGNSVVFTFTESGKQTITAGENSVVVTIEKGNSGEATK